MKNGTIPKKCCDLDHYSTVPYVILLYSHLHIPRSKIFFHLPCSQTDRDMDVSNHNYIHYLQMGYYKPLCYGKMGEFFQPI